MILFDLQCNKGHKFEAWFPSSSKYEEQVKKKLVSCPFCESKKIKKSLMAPNIILANTNKKKQPAKKEKESKNLLEKEVSKFKKFIEKNTENVGKNFAEEARKIYYGEKKSRPIRGETSVSEAKELVEEGIPFSKLPWPAKEDA
jgi:hypothetical protein